LKINGEELLETRDDGAFLDILKAFFQSIGEREDTENKHGQRSRLTVSSVLFFVLYFTNNILCIEIQRSHADSSK
jgi:hypothetical protein